MGSEMCIRDRIKEELVKGSPQYLVYNEMISLRSKTTIKNVSGRKVEIRYEREIEAPYKVEVVGVSVGSADVKSNKVVWGNIVLEPGEDAELIVEIARRERSDRYVLGEPSIELTIDENLSSISPLSASARCSNKFGFNIMSEEEPPSWSIIALFENISGYTALLKSISVEVPGSSEPVREWKVFKKLEPGWRWKNYYKIVGKAEISNINVTADAILLPRIDKRCTTDIKVESISVKTAKAGIKKAYDKERISQSYEDIVRAKVEFINTGSAPINEVEVVDTIPLKFKPPKLSEVAVLLVSKDGSEIYVEGEVEVTKDEMYHIVKVQIEDIEKATGKQLLPEEKVVVQYPFTTPKPKSVREKYSSPLYGYYDTKPRCKRVMAELLEELPVLKVEYTPKDIQLWRSVEPGTAKNEYVVTVTVQNLSNAPSPNLTIRETLPEGFDIIDSSIDVKRSGNVVEWVIEEVKENSEFEFMYKVRGKGEYTAMGLEVY